MKDKPVVIAVQSEQKDRRHILENSLRGVGQVFEVCMETARFRLGSLDCMLGSLDQLLKLEQTCETFLKNTEKLYSRLQPDHSLAECKINSNRFGLVSAEKFICNFNWDDFRFPRSSTPISQMRCLEEKIILIERNLKNRQLSFQSFETELGNLERRPNSKGENDISELLIEIISQSSANPLSEMPLSTRFLCTILIALPETRVDEFRVNYEFLNEFIVPKSLSVLGTVQKFVVAYFISFEEGIDVLLENISERFCATAVRATFDTFELETRAKKRKEIRNSAATERQAFLSICEESYKEMFVTLAHAKILRTIVDGCLRFSSMDDFGIFVLLFQSSNEEKVISSLVRTFAEPGKAAFYGTKEQLNDTEDFFPFVYVPFHLLS